MKPLCTVRITTTFGDKHIRVFHADALQFDEPIDVLTASAFYRAYNPTPGTLFSALYRNGVYVYRLAEKPMIDLRDLCGVWLSEEIEGNDRIKRLGCLEFSGFDQKGFYKNPTEDGIIRALNAYFYMLDIATSAGAEMKSVALPLLGSGCQRVSPELVMIPIIRECLAFLKRNPSVERIDFIEKNPEKAAIMAESLQTSYTLLEESISPEKEQKVALSAFISYSSGDRNIAENLCAKLEERGFSVWIAPRNVHGPYAASIVEGIQQANHFIVILSHNSLGSQHVLNEVDLAFKKLPNEIKFHPLRIDEAMFTPSFEYYLSRQHWTDAINPPLEQRLNEFVDRIMQEL